MRCKTHRRQTRRKTVIPKQSEKISSGKLSLELSLSLFLSLARSSSRFCSLFLQIPSWKTDLLPRAREVVVAAWRREAVRCLGVRRTSRASESEPLRSASRNPRNSQPTHPGPRNSAQPHNQAGGGRTNSGHPLRGCADYGIASTKTSAVMDGKQNKKL